MKKFLVFFSFSVMIYFLMSVILGSEVFAATESVAKIKQSCAGETGFCYTSLSDWEAAYGGINFGTCAKGNLVCAGKIAVAKIEGVWTASDLNNLIVDGWITGPNNYIKIYTAPEARHKGVLRSNGSYTGYTLETFSGSSVRSYEEYVKFDGIAIDNTSSGIYDSAFRMSVNNDASENVISNSVVKRTNGGSGYGAISKDFYYGRYKVINSIVYVDKIPGVAIRGSGSSSYVEVYNSTVYGYGLNIGIKSAVSQNNIAANFSQNFLGTSGDYNCSTDTTAPGANSLKSQTVSQMAFKSLVSQNEDFHLGINSVCVNKAQALTIFSDDIDSQIRTGEWDIGADETSAPIITPPDTAAPILSNGAPSGIFPSGTTQATMSLTTNENAACRYSLSPNISYLSMPFIFSTTGGVEHLQTMAGLVSGVSYNYYIRCSDLNQNANTFDYLISFSINTKEDAEPPSVSITNPLNNSEISGIVNISAIAADNIGITGVQFKIDNINIGEEDILAPFLAVLNTNNFSNSSHILTAVARDTDHNIAVSSQITVNINNQIIPIPTPDNLCFNLNILCVDDTPGITQEYSNIQSAANMVKPGDTVYVYDGVYSGFQVSVSGTKFSPISFAAKGNNVIIDTGGITGDGVRIQNASYIKIEGFKIKNVSERCIAARGATATSPMREIIILNNTCDNAGMEGFYLSELENSRIENNIIKNSGATRAERNHGIYLANAGSDNTIIKGNTVSGSRGIGSEGVHINGDLSVGGDGLISNLAIENNTVFNNATNGFSFDGVQDSLIQNNIIYGNNRHALRGYKGDGAAGPKNLKIVNNTFLAKTSGWAVKLSEDLGGHTIFNNILLTDGAADGSISVSNLNFKSNYNVLTDRFSVDNGLAILDLTKFQSLGHDTNSFLSFAANIFVNAALNDYHIKNGSVVIDSGINVLNFISAPSLDISGVQRPQGLKYDIGAYEVLNNIVPTPTPTPIPFPPPIPPILNKFKIGDIVKTTTNLNVRSVAGTIGIILGAQPFGSEGSVIGGPETANGYTWWKIDYINTPDGWSAENWLIENEAVITGEETYYISPIGSDLNSGTASAPFKTFKYAFSKMKSGSALIVKDGVYNQAFGEWKWQNSVKVPTSVPPSGTVQKYTTVKAENVRAIVDKIQIIGSSYIKIEGFKSLNRVSVDGSNHIIAKKIAAKGGFTTARSSYITKEDVWAWDDNRYVIHNYDADHIIDNRVIARLDDLGAIPPLPVGAISHYLTDNSIIANALLFDVSGIFKQPYDLVYSSRPNTGNDQIVGLIGFNSDSQLGGIYPADGGGSNYEVKNSVIWGTSKRCIRFNAAAPLKAVNNTCGENGGNAVYTNFAPLEVKNNIFYNNNGGVVGPVSICDNNVFYNSGVVPTGCANTSVANPGIKWLPRSPIVGKGANIEKKYSITEVNGKFTAAETTENLWPWPYEDLIKQDMCEGITKGWCGTNKTLSKYIWEYLGNSIPPEIYGGSSGIVLTPNSADAQNALFGRSLSLGLYGEDVKKLQEILNSNEDTQIAVLGPGSPGQETGYFGLFTKKALIRFQEKYREDILTPAGLNYGTGFLGDMTIKKIKELFFK